MPESEDDLYTELRIIIAQMRQSTRAAEESAAKAEEILNRLKGTADDSTDTSH